MNKEPHPLDYLSKSNVRGNSAWEYTLAILNGAVAYFVASLGVAIVFRMVLGDDPTLSLFETIIAWTAAIGFPLMVGVLKYRNALQNRNGKRR
jgi:hypothetical protein